MAVAVGMTVVEMALAVVEMAAAVMVAADVVTFETMAVAEGATAAVAAVPAAPPARLSKRRRPRPRRCGTAASRQQHLERYALARRWVSD